MIKTQSRTIHIGNQGENIIASTLSPKCIVRDVAQGQDTGIDLYCEILDDKTLELSLHFFCQVKTTSGEFSISSIEDRYYDYWARQPVPVFLFVVEYENEQNIKGTSNIWIYDIPYILAKRDAKELGKPEPERAVKEKILLCNENNNKDKMTLDVFLYGHVPWSHGLWQLRRFGLTLPNPEIKKKEKDIYVSGFTYLYEEKILKSISYAIFLLKTDKYNR